MKYNRCIVLFLNFCMKREFFFKNLCKLHNIGDRGAQKLIIFIVLSLVPEVFFQCLC